MAIVKMKRMRLIAPKDIRSSLIDNLTRLGCVEVESSLPHVESEEYEGILYKEDNKQEAAGDRAVVESALAILNKFVKSEKGLLSPRTLVKENDFYNKETVSGTLDIAKQINDYNETLATLNSEQSRLLGKKASFTPWESLDIPLDFASGNSFSVLFGVCQATADFKAMEAELTEQVPEAELILVSSDKEQHYVVLVCHSSVEEDALAILKTRGFSRMNFNGISGTARENIAQISKNLSDVDQEVANIVAAIKDCAQYRGALEQTYDLMNIESHQEEVVASLGYTKETVLVEGWVPEESVSKVEKVVADAGCAYEFSDPTEDEEPPVSLKNSKLVAPFGVVTELYALPTYRSGLDPNPFLAVFFFTFFGLMMGDFAYGVIISLASYFLLKKMRPSGAMKSIFQLGFLCGISTCFWGIMFGSYFGNVIPTVTEMLTGTAKTIPPVLMDPMGDPMSLFYLSLAFGFIQIFTGMGLSAWSMIKSGDFVGAICDIGFWYMILGGLVALALVGPVGGYVALAGAIGVLLTGGRKKPNFFGKITGGLGSLYGIANYFADILSYSRLLALSLATAVIAQVMNTMGSLGGNTISGWILFVVVFVAGHIFNVAVNLIGTFVHTSRLQYIEFFGKFYESGGKKFAPLYDKTKYVELTKEEK